MAITGTGTVDDPYLVNSYAELKALCTESGRTTGLDSWAKLMVDINCNEACPSHWETITMNMNFDMNNHKIIAPYLLNQQPLFYCTMTSIYSSFTIKNGEIINIFEDYSNWTPLFQGYYVQNSNGTCGGRCEFKLENMGLSIYVRGKPEIFNSVQRYGNTGSCYNSTIKISGTLLNYYPNVSGYQAGTIFRSGVFQNCRMILNKVKTNIYGSLWNQNNNNDAGRTPPVSNCRVEGETIGALNLGGSNIEGAGNSINCGLLKDMFIAIKEGKEAGWNDGINKYYSNGVSLFVDLNGGHSSFAPASDSNFKSVTEAEGKSVESVNNKGFVTIEVSG